MTDSIQDQKANLISSLIGEEKYFVHKGTWKNDYQWRIQKVKITGIKIDEKGEMFTEFSFDCCGYTYPVSWLQDTYLEAQSFAIKQINDEKKRQIAMIKQAETIL